MAGLGGSNQVKFVFPSEFDERWLERRISETMEAFRKKKGGIDSGKKAGKT